MKYPGPRTARLVADLLDRGWYIDKLPSGHFGLYDPTGRRRMTLPCTPKRTPRCDMNNVRDIKRAVRGFESDR